jgi:hypothetical protein
LQCKKKRSMTKELKAMTSSCTQAVPDQNSGTIVGQVTGKSHVLWPEKRPVVEVKVKVTYIHGNGDQTGTKEHAGVLVFVEGLRAAELSRDLEIGSWIRAEGPLHTVEREVKDKKRPIIVNGEELVLRETQLTAEAFEVLAANQAEEAYALEAAATGRVISKSLLDWTERSREAFYRATLLVNYSYTPEGGVALAKSTELDLVVYGECAEKSYRDVTVDSRVQVKGSLEVAQELLKEGEQYVLLSSNKPVMRRDTSLNATALELL